MYNINTLSLLICIYFSRNSLFAAKHSLSFGNHTQSVVGVRLPSFPRPRPRADVFSARQRARASPAVFVSAPADAGPSAAPCGLRSSRCSSDVLVVFNCCCSCCCSGGCRFRLPRGRPQACRLRAPHAAALTRAQGLPAAVPFTRRPAAATGDARGRLRLLSVALALGVPAAATRGRGGRARRRGARRAGYGGAPPCRGRRARDGARLARATLRLCRRPWRPRRRQRRFQRARQSPQRHKRRVYLLSEPRVRGDRTWRCSLSLCLWHWRWRWCWCYCWRCCRRQWSCDASHPAQVLSDA